MMIRIMEIVSNAIALMIVKINMAVHPLYLAS